MRKTRPGPPLTGTIPSERVFRVRMPLPYAPLMPWWVIVLAVAWLLFIALVLLVGRRLAERRGRR